MGFVLGANLAIYLLFFVFLTRLFWTRGSPHPRQPRRRRLMYNHLRFGTVFLLLFLWILGSGLVVSIGWLYDVLSSISYFVYERFTLGLFNPAHWTSIK